MRIIYLFFLSCILTQTALARTFYDVCKSLEITLNSKTRIDESSFIRSFRALRESVQAKDCLEAHYALFQATELNLGDSLIDDLTVLRFMPSKTSLRKINLSNTEISDISILSEFIYLEKILLFNTNIISLAPLEKLQYLKFLDTAETNLSSDKTYNTDKWLEDI